MKLSTFNRFFTYGLYGIATALWEFIAKGDWKCIGISSTWSIFIYGMATLFIEKLHPILVKNKISIQIRALIYTLCIFTWEFTTGYVLKQFNACPWDYSGVFNWNIMGLITFEYAPFWYFGSILCEQYLIPFTNRLHLIPCNEQKN